jgi:hypothetical protein
VGITSALGLAAFLLYSHQFWGGGLQSQYTAATGGSGDFSGRFRSVGPDAWGDFFGNIVGTLVSPGRGIVFGSPFLVVLAVGLVAAWRVAPAWVRSSAVGGLLYIAVQLKANRFQGGDPFWSYRYPIETLTLLAPLLVLAWRECVRGRPLRQAWFGALVTISVTLEAIGAICFPDAAPNGTIVWTFSDLHDALAAHPVAGGFILGAGCVATVVVFRLARISELADQRPDRPAHTGETVPSRLS